MDQPKAEVRGRGKAWRAFYPNEQAIASPVQVFDKEGVYKETVQCGTDQGGLVEANATFASEDEARAWLEASGYEVSSVTLKTRDQSLAIARQSQRRTAEARREGGT